MARRGGYLPRSPRRDSARRRFASASRADRAPRIDGVMGRHSAGFRQRMQRAHSEPLADCADHASGPSTDPRNESGDSGR